jgi:hypothetical protein
MGTGRENQSKRQPQSSISNRISSRVVSGEERRIEQPKICHLKRLTGTTLSKKLWYITKKAPGASNTPAVAAARAAVAAAKNIETEHIKNN